MKKTVVIGILGAVLDRGQNASRWEHWRPSVAI
ncbi:RNA repair transcriptional activator RtcR family protein [uncultured Desulfobacter sp.]